MNKSLAETCVCSAAINCVTKRTNRRRFYSLWYWKRTAKLQAFHVPTLCYRHCTWRNFLFWRL